MYVNGHHVLNASGYRNWAHETVTDKEKLYQSERYRQYQVRPTTSLPSSTAMPSLITSTEEPQRISSSTETSSQNKSEAIYPPAQPAAHVQHDDHRSFDRAANLHRLRRILVERRVQRSKKKSAAQQKKQQEQQQRQQGQEKQSSRRRNVVPVLPSHERKEKLKEQTKLNQQRVQEKRKQSESKENIEDNVTEMFNEANIYEGKPEQRESMEKVIKDRDSLRKQIQDLKKTLPLEKKQNKVVEEKGIRSTNTKDKEHIRKLEDRIHNLRIALRQKQHRHRSLNEIEEENQRLQQQVKDLKSARKKQHDTDETVKGQVKNWEKRYSTLQTRAQQLKDLVTRETKETASWRSMEILAEQQIHDLRTALSDVWVEANRERRRYQMEAMEAKHRANKAEEKIRQMQQYEQQEKASTSKGLKTSDERTSEYPNWSERMEWNQKCRWQMLYGAWKRLCDELEEHDRMEEDIIRLETELDQLRPHAWSLERELENLVAENQDLKEHSDFLQSNVANLSIDLDRTENTLADTLDEMRLMQYEHEVELGEMRVKLQELSSQHDTDEQVLGELKRTYDTALRRAEHLRQKLDDVKRKESEKKEKQVTSTERMRRRVEELEQQLSQEKSRHDSVLYQEQLTERSVKALQERLTETERHESELEDDIKGKEKEISDLVKQIEDMENNERQYQQQIQTLRNRCRHLEQEIKEKGVSKKKGESEHSTESETRKMIQSNEKLETELMGYKKKLANQKAIASKQANQLEELKFQLRQQEQDIAEKERLHAEAKDAEAAAKDKAKRLENTLSQQSESHIVEVLEMEESVRLASEEQLREQRKVKELQQALSRAKAEAIRNRMKLKDMESKMARKSSYQEREDKVMQESITALEKDLQQIQEHANAREEEFRRIIADLEHGLAAGQESRAAAQKRLEGMQTGGKPPSSVLFPPGSASSHGQAPEHHPLLAGAKMFMKKELEEQRESKEEQEPSEETITRKPAEQVEEREK